MESVRMRKGNTKHTEAAAMRVSRDIDIFMIYNPRSGSREAEIYTELPSSLYDFTMEDTTEVHLKITNLLIEEEIAQLYGSVQDALIQRLCKNPNDDKSVIILLCGGDGTFMNIVQEFKAYGIDINMLLFVVFPFGTANDIARNFGWGTTPSSKMLENLFTTCKEILAAKEVNFDVWEIDTQVNPETGDIQKPDGANLVSLEEILKAGGIMRKYMCHSFSFGSDARTGLSFERGRTRNRHCNRIKYAYEGFKNFIRCWGDRTLKLRQLLKTFSIDEQNLPNKKATDVYSKDNISEEEMKEDTALSHSQKKRSNVILSTDLEIPAQNYITNDSVSFYCLNLPSIMNGNISISNKASFNDGELEFATFTSLLHYILNRSNPLPESGGPFELKFIEDDDTVTYLNIDGEFYKLFNVTKINMRKADSLCNNGCLRVLVNQRDHIFD